MAIFALCNLFNTDWKETLSLLKDVFIWNVYLQVFFTVVVFGLFHGLAYLPVILSWIGPEPYHSDKTEELKLLTNGLSKSVSSDHKVYLSISLYKNQTGGN